MKVKTSELTGAALDLVVHVAMHGECEGYPEHPYSADWAHGGPIIEREGVALRRTYEDAGWTASKATAPHFMTVFEDGPTPLIAAMRCYVASRLGDEVEVPDSLISI